VTDGDVGTQEKRVEEGIGGKKDKVDTVEAVDAMENGNIKSDGQLQEAFGNTLRFPTRQRPAESKRNMDLTSSDEEIAKWFTPDEGKQIQIGEQLTETEKLQGMRLLYTWRDLFCNNVRELPAMDLIEHRIPTIKCNPVRSKPKLYTQKEAEWQKKHLPELLDAGIIDWVNSPWRASCKFPVKKNGDLRMVHIYCPINHATIKTNYPMKRMEPIINAMTFSSILGQFAYIRMGQGLTGAPHTYAQLKDLVMGPIPKPRGERPLADETEEFAFMTFFDDDMGATTSFETQLKFLHDQYFPRMHWAKLVLNPAKSHFFMPKIEMLELQADGNGIRPGNDKLRAFRNYPTPTCEKELDQFEYMTIYLRKLIPGRADHFRIMRKSVIKIPELAAMSTDDNAEENAAENFAEENAAENVANNNTAENTETNVTEPKANETKAAENRNKAGGNRRMADKRKVKMRDIGFRWSEEAEESFQAVKRSVLEHACHGGDPDRQYHLACDAFRFAYGGVLFQLADKHPMETVMSSKLVGSMRIIQFISKKFLDAETRYHTTEREALAIVRCPEETRWLVNENRHPVVIYTDHECLKMALQNSDKGRIVGWQLRLSEYDFRIIHIKGKENALADGM